MSRRERIDAGQRADGIQTVKQEMRIDLGFEASVPRRAPDAGLHRARLDLARSVWARATSETNGQQIEDASCAINDRDSFRKAPSMPCAG